MHSHNSWNISDRFREVDEIVKDLSSARFGNFEKVKLVVVTKGHPREACLEVIAAGAFHLGENYPEESVLKITENDLRTTKVHMIGHLQSRKIKYLNPLFSWIHSIDRIEIAKKVSDYYIQLGQRINTLVEVDFTGSNTKSGYPVQTSAEMGKFFKEFESFLSLGGLNLVGLMTMGNNPENAETNRKIFQSCYSLLEIIREKYRLNGFIELSMGTSGDFETAISEGSTIVRIGQRIMGQRIDQPKDLR